MGLRQLLGEFLICSDLRRLFGRDLGLRRFDFDWDRDWRSSHSLSMKITAPIDNFALSLLTGLVLGLDRWRHYRVDSQIHHQSVKFNFWGRCYDGRRKFLRPVLGPLIILSACAASIPIGIGATLGALAFMLEKTNCRWRYFRRNDLRCDLPSGNSIERRQ